MPHLPRTTLALGLFGLLSFLLAGLSIIDMFLPRPYDGVVLEADAPGELVVQQVVPDSGAHRAGIRPGDRITGVDRNVLRSPVHAAELLNRRQIGETVPYLVRGSEGLREVLVQLGRRRIGNPSYLYACLLGFSFFFIGLFVLLKRPQVRAAQVFFILGNLFLLFLVCRLRPASYSRIDSLILATGTAALLFLPATFLQFFLIFPKPFWSGWREDPFRSARTRKSALVGVYLLPPVVLAGSVAISRLRGSDLPLISGAPAGNWWVLTAYMLLGLTALAINASRLREPRTRRGAGLVLFGSVFGLIPFLVLAVAFPSFLHTEKFLFYGVVPLVLVPLTFAYAIVRFQLLDIRVILSKSILYTATSAVVTVLYAVSIVSFSALSRGTELATSPYFFIIFAVVIVLLFEPLRRRIQVPLDRFFFAERTHLQNAMFEMGRAFAGQVDLAAVVQDLVEKLPQQLGLHFAALYLSREDRLERVAGPKALPRELPLLPPLHQHLAHRSALTRLDELGPLELKSREVADLTRRLAESGVEVLGELASPRKLIGLVLLSGKVSQLAYDRAELELLEGLLRQAAMALETSMLLEERTRQAELERELEIAAAVQASLLPSALSLGEGWRVAAAVRPAKHVGGDFFTELPGPRPGARAIVYGDVAGKSVSGALVMMAAHEVLHSLSMTHPDPAELLGLANQRLHRLGQKSFVALAYLSCAPNGGGLDYMLAGQPQPLIRTLAGDVQELPLPEHRLPLGALATGKYEVRRISVEPGEVVLGYSDGVVDARSPRGQSFGTERLARVLATSTAEPEAVIQAVLKALAEFTEGTEAYDDVTLVALRCEGEITS